MKTVVNDLYLYTLYPAHFTVLISLYTLHPALYTAGLGREYMVDDG